MNKGIALIIAVTLIATAIVGYLTHINKSTGVPIHRHNEVYNILKDDTIPPNTEVSKNYTQPFKKYSLIENEEEIYISLPDSLAIHIQNSENKIEEKTTLPNGLTPR